MSLFRKRRYFWSHPGADSGPDPVEFFPQQDDVGYIWVRQENQIFYRLKIKDGLLIRNHRLSADFDYLNAIEIEDERCKPVRIDIYRKVPGSADVLEISCNARLDDADFDLDRCEIQLKDVESIDQYSRLTDKWENPINLIEKVTETVQVYTSPAHFPTPLSVIEEVTDDVTFNVPTGTDPVPDTSGWPDTTLGWVIVRDEWISEPPDMSGYFVHRIVTFRREVADTSFNDPTPAPPGGEDLGGWDWVEAYPGDFRFVRELGSRLSTEQSTRTVHPDTRVPSYLNVYSWLPSDVETFDNGMTLEHVLDTMLTENGTGLTVKSNVFQINPSGASPSDTPYDELVHSNIIIYERTDVKLPNASDPATILEVSLKQFLEWLSNKFQVFAVVQNDTLVIEHWSFFEGNQGLDLTVAPYAPALVGKKRYSYKRDEVPAGERFFDDGETFSQPYFRRWEFSYDIPDTHPNCLSKVTEVKETIANLSVNDIQELVANPQNFSDDGLSAIAAVEYDGKLLMTVDPLRDVANWLMSPLYVGPRFWMHNRYFFTAIRYLRGTDPEELLFLSYKKYRKQVALQIPLCDISDFDPLDQHKNQWGWADVTGSPEFSPKLGVLTLELLNQGWA